MENLLSMEQEFHAALENREFHVWYQPQTDMRTGELCGAEALVRWGQRGGGLMQPDSFVPFLEKLGLITRLDEEVLRTVCRDIRQAGERGIDLSPVSVNLSGLQAGRRGSAEKIKRITEEYGVECGALIFEITETAEKEEKGLADFAAQLQEKGFRIAMDVYGTGYSSLKALHEIHFDVLKLDRYFVGRVGDPKAEIILASTMTMAENLGLEVVAEGVETEDQIRFLLDHQCHLAQGYYYSRPLTKEQYIRWQQVRKSCRPEERFPERKFHM